MVKATAEGLCALRRHLHGDAAALKDEEHDK